MINILKSNYKLFSDAIIKRVEYKIAIENNMCSIEMQAYNWKTNQHDCLIIFFIDCIFFKFFESTKINSTTISNALLKDNDGIITFDFFPLYYSENKIEENTNSDFIIKCKEISFEII